MTSIFSEKQKLMAPPILIDHLRARKASSNSVFLCLV